MRPTTRKLTAVSLFSGCLGLDLGMELSGIHAAVCVEKDRVCRDSIKLNRPNIICFDDIFGVSGRQLIKAAGGNVDVVIGGPPCQPFSTAGKRRIDDERGKAVMEYVRIVNEIRPRFFVMENVVGLLSTTTSNGESLIQVLIALFERMLFHVECWKLNSNEYGSPQKRLRVVLIGASANCLVRKPQPVAKRYNLRDAILDLEEESPSECVQFSPKVAKYLIKIPQGGDWRNLNTRDRNVAMGGADRKSGGLTSFYRRLSYDRPCPTLVTSPTQRKTTLCHPKYTRPLSVAEYRRVQGFPDTWALAGTVAQKYRQLGNAVPVALAKAIGTAVMDASLR